MYNNLYIIIYPAGPSGLEHASRIRLLRMLLAPAYDPS